ncbi:hypothetical protein BKA81DRAFT_146846 [Phyllosticta paracitricarpa]
MITFCLVLFCFAFFCCTGCGLRFLGLHACIATALLPCSLPIILFSSSPPLLPSSHLFLSSHGNGVWLEFRHGLDRRRSDAMRCTAMGYTTTDGRNGTENGRSGSIYCLIYYPIRSALLYRRLGKGYGGWVGGWVVGLQC